MSYGIETKNKNAKMHHLTSAVLLSLMTLTAHATSDPIVFSDIAKNDFSGIDYRRTPSENDAIWDSLRSKDRVHVFEFATGGPLRSRGAPGVAVLDYDKDGDLDVYVTNGPGKPNSLYSNQQMEQGMLRFIDTASFAGVGLSELDSTGICYGDTDNDGDYDLYVLSNGDQNHFLENNGDGTFTDKTHMSEVGGRLSYSAGCSMGDINGDGLLDIVVANTITTWDSPLQPTDHNQLFVNDGENSFSDVSQASGITTLGGFEDNQEGAAGLTWAISMVDYDQDGDIDIFMVDDESIHPVREGAPGVKGYIHIMNNDGSGKFTDKVVESGTNINGAWMALAFGDLNSDGFIDMYVSNIGDYMNAEYFPYGFGDRTAKWFLGQEDHSFLPANISESEATAFGWGAVMSDYDNDGDSDIIFHGGMDGGPLVDAGNPGLIMDNNGYGNFTLNKEAFGSEGHQRRNVQGLAQGDMNNDGFIDFVSVSNFDIPESVPLTPYSTQWGAATDDIAYFVAAFENIGPMEFRWNGYTFDNGTLSIDINGANNDNKSVFVNLMGTVGILEGGKANRDGVGSVVTFKPQNGLPVLKPIVAGDSYASQSELKAHFGVGDSAYGDLEVLWSNGVRNKLYRVKANEKISLPEIPCSYETEWAKVNEYKMCVSDALDSLYNDNYIDQKMKLRLLSSALRAYQEHRS